MDNQQPNGGTGSADGQGNPTGSGRRRRAWEELGGLGGDIILAGRYKLGALLGEGYMGTVWKAEDLRFEGWPVVLKMVPQALEGRKILYRQVEEAAREAMRLSHLNIVTVRGFEDAEGTPFAVLDYIEGRRLDTILADRGRLTAEETMMALEPVAAALDYAHGVGVLHRDVRPGNVLVRKDGTPFVRDFGISRAIQEAMVPRVGNPQTGPLEYMSPEQLQGGPPTAAQDVYSFATMAYECLMGRPPFGPDDLEEQIVNQPPAPIPENLAGELLRAGIMAGLSKNPEERPKSCAAVLMGDSGRKPEAVASAGEADGGQEEGAGNTEHSEDGTVEGTLEEVPRQKKNWGPVFGRWAALVLVAVVAGIWWGEAKKRQERIAPQMESQRLAADAQAVQEQQAAEEALRKAEEERLVAESMEAENHAAESARMGAEREERIRLESEALEKMAYRLEGMARTKAGNAERVEYGPGPEVGGKLGEMKENLRQGEMALQGRNFARAKECFDASIAAAAWLEENAPVRQATAECNETGAVHAEEEAMVWPEEVRQGLEAAWEAERREVREEVVRTADGALTPDEGDTEAQWVKESAEEEMKSSGLLNAEEHGMTEEAVVPEEVERPGKSMIISLPGGVKMEMVWCPPGTFTMGSRLSEAGRFDEEMQHRVRLTKGFWMAKYEVTQKQWRRVMGSNPSHFIYVDKLPVECVSWNDCQEFCRRAGHGLRLPTEAEWEYACRAGGTGAYGGGGRLEDMGWYRENSGEQTHPVAQKRPNAWGLYDMHGNVREWCEDWYGVYPDRSSRNPAGPARGATRVVRGGNWFYEAGRCRSACRDSYYPTERNKGIGFRPCMSSETR